MSRASQPLTIDEALDKWMAQMRRKFRRMGIKHVPPYGKLSSVMLIHNGQTRAPEVNIQDTDDFRDGC